MQTGTPAVLSAAAMRAALLAAAVALSVAAGCRPEPRDGGSRGEATEKAASGSRFPGSVDTSSRDAADHVAVEFSLSRDTLSRGAGAAMLVAFAPADGYHVNAVPALSVAFDPTSAVDASGDPDLAADTATGYLDSSVPVRQGMTLRPSAVPGSAEVRGVLTYYYCSDAEGWCRRERLPFALPATVR